jgi:hypothetical protein
MIVSKRSSGKGRQSSIGWTFLPQQWPCRRATRTSAQTSRTDIVLAREAHHDVHVGALRLGHVQVDVELHVVDQDLVGVVGNDRLTVQKPGSAMMLDVLGIPCLVWHERLTVAAPERAEMIPGRAASGGAWSGRFRTWQATVRSTHHRQHRARGPSCPSSMCRRSPADT